MNTPSLLALGKQLLAVALLVSLPGLARLEGSRLIIIDTIARQIAESDAAFVPNPGLTAQDDALREAVFLYQRTHWSGGPALTFLAVQDAPGHEPSSSLRARLGQEMTLGREMRMVREGSDAGQGYEAKMRERSTGRPGLYLSVSSVQWISPTEAEVVGFCYETRARQVISTYHLVRQGGAWVVAGRVDDD